jgi:hypothetical protein
MGKCLRGNKILETVTSYSTEEIEKYTCIGIFFALQMKGYCSGK